MSADNKFRFPVRALGSNGLRARWALPIVVCLLSGFAHIAFAQTRTPDGVATQSDTGSPDFRVESKLVIVRVIVADKKAWQNGPRGAGDRCALNAEVSLARLPATEPFLPADCEGLFVRGLAAKNFHVLVDGEEQRIESVTSASQGLRIRDNLGWHDEYSQTPAGKWSTISWRVPRYIVANAVGYGLLARNRYDVSFVPHGSDAVGCHKIKLNVDRRSTIVAARDEYCASESPSDILNGSTFGKQLEHDLASGRPGEIPLALQAAVFEGDNDGRRIRIALEFPVSLLSRRWRENWTLDATIGVFGVIYRHDGTLASRFSDFSCCTPEATGIELGAPGKPLNRVNDILKQSGLPPILSKAQVSIEKGTLPTRYETEFDLPPGEYDLRIILSDGEKFGRAETHLKVENFDGKEFALSSVVLSNRYRDAHVAEVETRAANFAPQYVPMVSKGVQVTPVGDTTFAPNESLIAYFELYAPQQAAGSEPGIRAHLRIVDAKSGQVAKDFPAFDVAGYEQIGKAIVPIARKVPVDRLSKGEYRLEVQASDAVGHSTVWKTANFAISSELPLQKN